MAKLFYEIRNYSRFKLIYSEQVFAILTPFEFISVIGLTALLKSILDIFNSLLLMSLSLALASKLPIGKLFQ